MTEFSSLRQRARLSVPEAAEQLGYDERQIYRFESGEIKARRVVLERLRELIPVNDGEGEGAFTFIDLFAGIGGMRLGFESAGGKCVFTSEWNAYSQKTYRANFPSDDHEIAGDITEINEKEIPPHDVLVAGFPCQPFSIAGVSKKNALNRPHGFDCDTQGTLFFDIERIIKHHRPKAFLLENVKNLVSHDGGRTFGVIMDVLERKLKYQVSWRVIDAKGWVPQHRERTFIVGFREDCGFNIRNIDLPDVKNGPKLGSILHGKNEKPDAHYTDGSGATDKYTLTRHLWTYLQNYAEKHRKAGNGFGFGLFGPNDTARTLSARYFKDGSEILIKQGPGRPPRRLTPRECARLMGFDRAGRKPFQIPVSDTQAYKQFGNAVVVPVVEHIAKHMLPFIVAAEEKQERKRVARG
ncbi:MAG TPA: DNA (cytosine-5-)-methyltransferase [Rhizomicrobium sp.]